MRKTNPTVLSAADNQTTSGAAIDTNQIFGASFHMYFGDTNAAGTLKIQASNDIDNAQYLQGTFTPSKWVDIPNQSASITSGSAALLTLSNMAYRWVRPVYTTTAAGVQIITAIADTGVKQIQTIDTVADVAGSLNNTYFLISSVNLVSKAQKNFYVWFDNGTGVDPAVPGKTGVQVTYSDNDTADTIAGNARTALGGLTNDFTITGATNHIIAADKAYGRVTAAADSAVPTGFTFTDTTPGVTSNLTGKYFLLNSEGQPADRAYYVWFNVDTISTNPAPAGKTAIAVAISSGSSASSIGGTMATAIAAAHSSADFSATNSSGAVTVTNLVTGPWTAASDFNSGFSFAISAGGTTTVTVNMFALGV